MSFPLQAQRMPNLLRDSTTVNQSQSADQSSRSAKAPLTPIVVGDGITPSSYTSAVGVPFTLPVAYAFSSPTGKPLSYFIGGFSSLYINGATGVISGIPENAGRFGITVGAQDGDGNIVYSGFTLITKEALEIRSPQSATVGVPLSIPTAYAFFLPAVLTCNSLPPGLRFDARSGLITGTPTINGHFGITIAGTNSLDQPESHGFYLDVQLNPAINEPPRQRGNGLTSPQSATIGQPFSLSVTYAYDFYDPEGLPLTYLASPCLPV
ncbi:putative Ig domain-containing protein [Spirosoma telluris]